MMADDVVRIGEDKKLEPKSIKEINVMMEAIGSQYRLVEQDDEIVMVRKED